MYVYNILMTHRRKVCSKNHYQHIAKHNGTNIHNVHICFYKNLSDAGDLIYGISQLFIYSDPGDLTP